MKIYQNLCNKTKEVLKGKFIALSLILEEEKSQTNNLSFHFNNLGWGGIAKSTQIKQKEGKVKDMSVETTRTEMQREKKQKNE